MVQGGLMLLMEMRHLLPQEWLLIPAFLPNHGGVNGIEQVGPVHFGGWVKSC